MGAGHSHSHSTEELEHVGVNWTARNVLIGFLAVIGVLTVAGLIWLWPSGQDLSSMVKKVYDAQNLTHESATITDIKEGCDTQQVGQAKCLTATVTISTGEDAGTSVEISLLGPQAQSGLRTGDVMEVNRIDTGNGISWSYSSVNRLPVLGVLAVLFVVVVLAVARWKGLFALLGLGFAGVVLVGFMLPALITGKPGIAVALVGGTAIMFVVLYVAHGVSIRTSTALAGTLLGLAVTAGLGALSAEFARLSGFAEENEYDLAQLLPGMNFRELLMVGIIVGGLGVLNDVTITQSSAVWELRAAAPRMGRGKLFAAGMRIGRDHIASTIYTIVFAYAGGSMAVLLLLYFTDRPATALLNAEMFASEIVRTLGSAIGLILSVPITTGIAALTVASPEPEPQGRHAVGVEVE
ncbi:YibE/F family protein [[Pseudopropionibacterium] massiliense]|uniref:YibE/F family protein n=1 Tax=[Pseudopropionibacterium] massiliense TaxID=2220000 RepID=UPI001A91B6C3|nr:YibE/F family protein [[Pseudopropionibacterium] massiliense]